MKISISVGMANVVNGVDGYCPLCGAPVRMHMAEKDQCWNGHIYPAADTKPLDSAVFREGDRVTVREKRQGYPLKGVVVEEENEQGLVGVELAGAVPNNFGNYVSHYPKERLEKA